MIDEEKLAAKEKILKAALEIFIIKGKDGARMQEIANHAGVNKAMLFYYYTSKDLLYQEVLRHNISEIVTSVGEIMISEFEPEKKIEEIVNAYLNFFKDHPHLPKLILREIASGGENIKEIFREVKGQMMPNIPSQFISLIEQSVINEHFRSIDPKQTIISIVGMCIIYFVGKPIIETILELEDVDQEQFIEQRKKNILHILKYGLLARRENDLS